MRAQRGRGSRKGGAAEAGARASLTLAPWRRRRLLCFVRRGEKPTLPPALAQRGGGGAGKAAAPAAPGKERGPRGERGTGLGRTV